MADRYLVSDNETLKWQNGDMAYCLHIMHDDDAESPINDETLVKLAFFGRNHSLGNDPRSKHMGQNEYMVQLCRDHVEPADVIAKIKANQLNGLQVMNERMLPETNETLITLRDVTTNDIFEDVCAGAVIDILADNLTADHCRTLLQDVVFATPIWVYEHSGISIKVGDRTYPYNDQWDSYYGGIAAITKAAVIENFQDTENWQRKASECIQNVIETYDSYLTGDVWGYQLYELDMETYKPDSSEPNWNETESVWGFIDCDIMKSGLAESVGEGLTDAIREDRVTSGTVQTITVVTHIFGNPE